MSQALVALRQQYQAEMKKIQGIQIRGLPLHPYVPSGVKLQEVPVLIQILIGDYSKVIKREPLHVCAVLDRSGSMSGAPLQNCKEAIKEIMNSLDQNDELSFVTYDTSAETVFEHFPCGAANMKSASALISRVHTGGCTDISAGLFSGIDILRKTEPGRQRVMFLFSDGCANAGITDLDRLGTSLNQKITEHNIQISSFGIGEHYNETWLSSIARCGKGNYFFIKNMEQINDIVDRGLSGYTTILAKDVKLRARGVNGHTLLNIQNVSDSQTLIEGYKLANLRSMGMYNILVKMDLAQNPPLDSNNASAILEFHLDYTPIDNAIIPPGLSGIASITYTSDRHLLCQKDPDVQCYMVTFTNVPLEQKIDSHMQSGNVKEAIACKQEVIRNLTACLPYDRFASIQSQILRAKELIDMLEKQGASDATKKCQDVQTAWGYGQAKAAARQDWEDECECDEDMGFGLYD